MGGWKLRDDVVVTFGDTFLSEREILRLASLAQYDNNGELYCYGRQKHAKYITKKRKIQQDFLHLTKRVFRTASPESFGR